MFALTEALIIPRNKELQFDEKELRFKLKERNRVGAVHLLSYKLGKGERQV